MSDWYEVYDNEEVQQQTRLRVRRALLTAVLGIAAAAVLMPLVVMQPVAPLLGLALLAALMFGLIGIVSRQLLRLRRVVWCIKLSVHRIVGYDYARRKTVLPWSEIERIDVDGEGLLITSQPRGGRPGPVLRIPTLFPDYARLSHRVVEYAEAHGVPVCVEGRPWQLLDLSALYPFMAGQPVVERPGEPPLFGGPDAAY